MSVNPTSSSTKLIAIGLVVAVIIISIFIVILTNRNPSVDPNPSFDNSICWNTVIDGEYWANGCKGSKDKEMVCTQALVELTAQEKVEYKNWFNAGKPLISGCE